MFSPTWKDLYDKAVLEPHPDKVAQRVQIACDAIHEYRLQKGRWLPPEEREEIEAALKALFVLIQRRAA
jgi:hypothetical protein